MSIWVILAIIAGVLLIVFWRGRNAVWGAATLGVIVGIILSLGKSKWNLMLPCFTIGTFAGLVGEGLGALSDRLKKTEWYKKNK
jgi:uncharacterized membrane protein